MVECQIYISARSSRSSLQEFYDKAGLPSGLLQTIHLGTLSDLEALVARPEIVHVAFTGSVAGGLAVQKAAMNSFKRMSTFGLCLT